MFGLMLKLESEINATHAILDWLQSELELWQTQYKCTDEQLARVALGAVELRHRIDLKSAFKSIWDHLDTLKKAQ